MIGRSDPSATLGETLAHVSRLGAGYRLEVEARGADWVPAMDLIGGGPGSKQALGRLVSRADDPVERRAIGSQLVLCYLRFVWPAVAAFALERRVPDVGGDNLLVRFDDEGWPSAFGLIEPRFGVLAADPAERQATLATSDEGELIDWLLERVVEHNAAPLIEAVRRRFGTSGTALWGNVAAAFAIPLLWHVQLVAADSPSVVRDARSLLARERSQRLQDKVRYLTVVHRNAEWTLHARRTCCLRWSLPAGVRCEDCPLVREPESTHLLKARLAEAVDRGEALRKELGLEPFARNPAEEAQPT